jgi:BlaI family transcriptional regulator, penicillinase repressor
MPKSKPVDVALSDPQIAVMRVLWQRGAATTAEVVDALERDLAHTTVATMLTRLEKRGVVEATRDGRQVSYRALVDEPEVRRSMVAGLLGSLFGGDAKALVAHLVREDEVAPGDLDKIKRLLATKARDDA